MKTKRQVHLRSPLSSTLLILRFSLERPIRGKNPTIIRRIDWRARLHWRGHHQRDYGSRVEGLCGARLLLSFRKVTAREKTCSVRTSNAQGQLSVEDVSNPSEYSLGYQPRKAVHLLFEVHLAVGYHSIYHFIDGDSLFNRGGDQFVRLREMTIYEFGVLP